jgi:hypothetical protein
MTESFAVDRPAAPTSIQFGMSSAAIRPSRGLGFDPPSGSPAVIIGAASVPSVFVIYNASGQLQGGGVAAAGGPNPRIVPPSLDLTASGIPAPLLFQQLGRTIYEITLETHSGAVPNVYTLGYRLLA